ncbi:hypothetical protein K504DRAFT_378969 [Pleomassaria siparia CBS 279.74]|uniref:RING-type E3 ubiquitin transferase n=1 Tax=Pleomassaria siparia CBS 279.74 TaxID=1314801 RepID=A0A6G1KAI6_9PLEO|nr:hypothetical protein K504DRAFT_378969 [Pleomassaria siparia CBS 279.74]
MRPLRLLLSLGSSLTVLALLLYIAFGSQHQDRVLTSNTPAKGKVKPLFSFTSPASLFPPSAIISLTDDNSTFFMARPAAFGPLLPTKGLSGPLWIGSGFGDEAMGRGELGCSDVPGWDGDDRYNAASEATQSVPGSTRTERTRGVESTETLDVAGDGTDDHLHQPLSASKIHKPLHGKTSGHADIQSLQEGAEIAGKVVLLKRGGCGFLEKTKWAQRRGGVALIVGDDVRGGSLIVMNARGDTSDITIPALFTSHTTSHLLSSLLPTGNFIHDLSPEDAAKLDLIKSGKASKQGKKKDKSGKAKTSGDRTAFAQDTTKPNPNVGWLRSLLYALGFGSPRRTTSRTNSLRPPSSGGLDWVQVEDWEDDHSNQKPIRTKSSGASYSKPTQTPGDFVIGEQDWRDPGLLPQQTSTHVRPLESTKPKEGWFSNILAHDEDFVPESELEHMEGNSNPSLSSSSSLDAHSTQEEDDPEQAQLHDGLWVTLAPTNMSSSPFFDTLLVLVVSPLVTLTVVYALLLLRSRIRRRRWRAPKSVVERLPVRTYHTLSDASSSPTTTPNTSSPTTPLLQHSHSPPTSSLSRPRSRATLEVPALSSSVQPSNPQTEEEKREAGLAQWRRRYGGRQKECVVCLEEYVDGISKVMSLPCGHEFHADCITPWLVTRRRTCPICKGDVVRSLSQSYRDRRLHSPSPAHPSPFLDDPDNLQVQAAQTRNDSPSASQPVPISSSSMADYSDDLDADIEANWRNDTEDDELQGRDIPRDSTLDLSSSVRDLSSTVSTTIWRGFEAVRSAAGLQRRPSQDLDRDR